VGGRQILQKEVKAPVDELRVVAPRDGGVGHQRRGLPIEGHLAFSDRSQTGVEAVPRGLQE
jgi:hypothetical protein